MKLTDEQRKLAEDNINLARHLTIKYLRNGVRNYGYDDLFSIFLLGLCKASLSYNSSKGKFSTYAPVCMINELNMDFRKQARIERNVEPFHVFESKTGDMVDVIDILYEDCPGFENIENDIVLSEAMHILSNKEKRILGLRYYHELTQQEISDHVHFARSYCCRVEKRALKKLRQYLA